MASSRPGRAERDFACSGLEPVSTEEHPLRWSCWPVRECTVGESTAMRERQQKAHKSGLRQSGQAVRTHATQDPGGRAADEGRPRRAKYRGECQHACPPRLQRYCSYSRESLIGTHLQRMRAALPLFLCGMRRAIAEERGSLRP